MDLSRIYPILVAGADGEAVPAEVATALDEFSQQAPGEVVVGREGDYQRPPAGWMPPLGHGVYVMLYYDGQGALSQGGGGTLHCLLPGELEAAKVSPAEAHRLALENLERLARAQTFRAGVHSKGPQGRPFARWGGHRLAASCILLPGVFKWASKLLATDEVCASIPRDDSLVLFAKGDQSYRDEMRAMIREAEEADTRPPLSFDLFVLSAGGVSAFREAQ
jgi:hypothetical protein